MGLQEMCWSAWAGCACEPCKSNHRALQAGKTQWERCVGMVLAKATCSSHLGPGCWSQASGAVLQTVFSRVEGTGLCTPWASKGVCSLQLVLGMAPQLEGVCRGCPQLE